MPANFCLMPETVQKFKVALKDGKIDPEKMANMTSAERNEFLSGIVGKNHARAVNALFEEKMLLKNQKQGYINWAKRVSGINPATRRDIIARIERMDKVLDPEDGKQFLSDLTARRLGVDVTEAEAKNIADLSKSVTEAESLRRPDKTFPSEDARFNYGYAIEDLTDYVASLKQDADKLKLGDIKRPTGGLIGKFAYKTAGNLKSLQASLDNSAVFRQGWKVLWTDPGVWAKNAAQTFSTAVKTVGGKNVMRQVNADIVSRPNYEKYVKAKLAIKDAEEAFPESLAEKVPALGRLYKASESAFTSFQYKNRADLFDKYLEQAKNGGVDIEDPEQLKAIGNLVNSLTGRGNIGKLEPIADSLNVAFFSPRFLKSNIDTLTAHQFQKGVTPFVRKKAAKNLAKVVAGTAGVLATANAVMPGSVELDPRSSDFGKIRIGDTRFDVSGGMGSILTLAARFATQSSKSAASGKITQIDSGKFGAPTTKDILSNFLWNKTSPAVNILLELKTGTDFTGKKIPPEETLLRGLAPIGGQTFFETLNNPNAAPVLLTMILDGLGVGANTYSASGGGGETEWEGSDSKQIQAFREHVGDEKFKQGAETFDRSFNEWMNSVKSNDTYKSLSDDEKAKMISKKKDALQKSIFSLNGFKYKTEKRDTSNDWLIDVK